MRTRIVSFAIIAFILDPVPPAGAQNCDGLINHGMNNISVIKSDAAATATKYYNNCG